MTPIPDVREALNARARRTIGRDIIPANAVARENGAHDANAPVATMHVVPMSSVTARPVRWLWRGRLTLGKLVVMDGWPGQGKSAVALDVAARGSRGRPMPDGTQEIGAPFDTLIITYEDDAEDTLKPRLMAAGADVSRVAHVAGVSYNGDDEPLPPSLPKDLALLERTLRERPSIRLVIIDPLAAAVGAEVDTHRDQDVRRVLARLARIAQECNVCIAVIRHVKKTPGSNAIAAGGGSIGIIGQARVGLLVERHPEESDVSVLAVAKCNIAAIAPSLAFRKMTALVRSDAGEEIETTRLEWLGASALSADELLAGREETLGDNRDASQFLREMLAAGEMERRDVLKAGGHAGFPERTLDRAAKRLGVVKRGEGFGAAKRAFWGLPSIANPAKNSPIPPIPPHILSDGNGGNGAEVAGMESDAGIEDVLL